MSQSVQSKCRILTNELINYKGKGIGSYYSVTSTVSFFSSILNKNG